MKNFQKNWEWRGVALGTILAINAWVCSGQAAETNASASAEADTAWREVERACRAPMPPAEWQGHPTPEQIQQFRAQESERAAQAADKAKDFYTRFPEHRRAADARKKETEMLQVAVQLGNTNKIAVLEERDQERLKDPNLSEDERLSLRMQGIRRAVMVKQSQGQAAVNAEVEARARELIKEFPKRPEGFQLLFQVAGESEGDKARALAKEIIAGTDSEEIKSAAEGLLRKLEALGKPLDIQFTAVDGRKVDLKELKNKVVLIDFWATWCGPCVGELPNVKKAYDNLHAKGFEIVGISFDSDQAKLEKFVSDKSMAWPQYFDGKQWANKLGKQYGINSIPTMWLVDKKGNLRDMNARGALEEKVAKLLEE